MPWLAQSWALLGLLALPALAALYFLRNRFRRQPVSSLLLWTRAARPREGGRRLERMTAPLTFFLEALALTLLTVAAADPRRPLPQARRPLIAVLDDSASMSAREPDGSTPRARAERALAEAAAARETASVRLIYAGLEPRAGETMPAGALRAGLDEWTCRAPGDSLDRALSLAHELGRGRARILVLTDRAPAAPPEGAGVRWLAFGRPAPNAAIVAAARSPGAARDRILVEIAGFAAAPFDTRVTIRGAGPSPETRALRLDPAAPPHRLSFETPADAGDIEIALADDALAADNRAVLLRAPRAPVRVRLDLRPALRREVERALTAAGRASIVDSPPVELAFSDRGDDAADAADWQVRFAGAGEGAVSFAGPYIARPRHPLLEGLALEGVVWGARPLDDPPGTPILFVGDRPLIADEPRVGGRRVLRIAFDPAASDLHRTPNWPALFWNLLEWRAAERPGPAEINGRAGGEALVRTPGTSTEAVVRAPDARPQRMRARAGRLVVPAAAAGVYEIEMDGATHRLARNFLAPEESDLRGAASGDWGRWADGDVVRRETASIAWPFALAAFGALALHGRLAGRTKT